VGGHHPDNWGIKAKAFWAIVASSVLWSAPHAATKSIIDALLGIFPGGLIFGYVYFKSRSVLLPAWIHAVANAGYAGGLFVTAVYCVVSVADRMVQFKRSAGVGGAALSHRQA
jgi:membrane protease YdiL (CAAX protease family)